MYRLTLAWRSWIVPTLLIVTFVIGAISIQRAIGDVWYGDLELFTVCSDDRGQYKAKEQQSAFDVCIKRKAEGTLKFDYPEYKDLAKTFLTLLSATLVASLTFSEKVVDIATAPVRSIWLLFICWAFLCVGIGSCVIGISLMTSAAWTANVSPSVNYQSLELDATSCIFLSVGSFVLAMLALVVAGATSIVHRRRSAEIATPSIDSSR